MRISDIRRKPSEPQPDGRPRPKRTEGVELKPLTRTASEDKHLRSSRQRMEVRAYRPFLDELRSHWNNTYTPDPAFSLETPEVPWRFFRNISGHWAKTYL